MADLPPLPESDDPFELLGIDPEQREGLDQRGLKRAYVRRIKVYKPEKAPEEFKRLREAYERAQHLLDYGAFALSTPPLTPTSDEDGDTERSSAWDEEPPEPEPELPPEVSRAWELLADGAVDAAHELLAGRVGQGDAPGRVHAALFLIEEARGASFAEASRVLVRALEQGATVAEFLCSVLDHGERRRLVLEPAFAWSSLRRQEAELFSAYTLWRQRVHVSLLLGRFDELGTELRSAEVSGDALRYPFLGSVCLEAAIALAWDEPELSQELFEIYARHDGLSDTGSLETMHLDRRGCREMWERAEVDEQLPSVADLIKLGAVVDEELLGELLTTVQMDVRARPLEHLEVLDRIYSNEPILISILHGTIDHHLSYEATLEELNPKDRDGIHDGLMDVDALLEKDTANSIHSLALGVGVIAQIGSFFIVGWWGLLGLIPLIGLFALTWRIDDRLYKSIIRPKAVELLGFHPVSPLHLAQVVRETAKSTQDLCRFDDELEEDVPLHALGWLMNVDAETSW